jgi:hypothetical protein
MARQKTDTKQTPESIESEEKPKGKSAEELDRVRDIIFGSRMKQYEKNFSTLQQDMGRLQQEIARLNEQLAELETTETKKVQVLRREMTDKVTEVRTELRQRTQELDSDKVDRSVLGELFIEIGNQIKTGGSLADLLAGLVESE